ncbi:MAG: winged helix-turn-helix domain-containing protein [Lachnospiraceae bacterium]|nr:winged helix-turn-helix domain-containing protein [Muribaculum sp.]MCM1409885.1 winged helix-turn-helix domain-containing protein [Lachnospiraceae bacterium]
MTEADKSIVYGKLHIYPGSRIVYIDEQEVVLTKMEFDVLYFLASNPDIAFTREQIYDAVSKDDYSGGAYIIRDIIYRLRTKLKITNIRTLHGYGYKFCIDHEKNNEMS